MNTRQLYTAVARFVPTDTDECSFILAEAEAQIEAKRILRCICRRAKKQKIAWCGYYFCVPDS